MGFTASAIGTTVSCYRREFRQLLGEVSRRERTGPAPLIHGLLRSRSELAELHQPFVALLHQRVGRAVAEFVERLDQRLLEALRHGLAVAVRAAQRFLSEQINQDE